MQSRRLAKHNLVIVRFFTDIVLFLVEEGEEKEPSPDEVLVFELKVSCSKNPHPKADSTDPNDLWINHKGDLIMRIRYL